MKARLYNSARPATQSGEARTGHWILEYIPKTGLRPESVMGWTSSQDTRSQVVLRFSTLEEASAFAAREGLSLADIAPERKKRITPRSYTDNFKYRPPVEAGE